MRLQDGLIRISTEVLTQDNGMSECVFTKCLLHATHCVTVLPECPNGPER